MKIVQEVDKAKWSDFVYSHPNGNIFQTPEMFQVFARTRYHNPFVWATVNNNNYPLALLLPVQITLTYGLLHRLTTRAIAYGSILWNTNTEGKEALRTLLLTYKKKIKSNILFTELRNLSNMNYIQPLLKKYGFAFEEHLNYLIDLNRSPEEIFQSFGRRTRKHIRRGLKRRDVIIVEAREKNQVATCYRILQQTYQKARIPLPHYSLFEGAYNILYPKNMIRFTLAYVDQNPIATSIDLLYKNIIYGWYGGVNRAYSSYTPNELMTWDILKWGKEKGYRLYDFGGAGKPLEEYGVRNFKAKFGGETVFYGRNICVHNPFFLWLSKFGYRVFRRLIWH